MTYRPTDFTDNSTADHDDDIIGLLHDALVLKLSQEADFMSTKTVIEEEMEKIGASVLFTPKFHPGNMIIVIK